ncbi:MAG: LuxR C-terminal-related transcriptional regulator [Planctomycetaceae bacterium]
MRNQEAHETSETNPAIRHEEAIEIRRLIEIGLQSHSGVPVRDLVHTCSHLSQTRLTIDFSAAQIIGVPVVVLREHSTRPVQPIFEKLSDREREVATLIAAGCGNAQIARRLGISIGTVKDHVHHALTKTRLKTRTELAAALAREGV